MATQASYHLNEIALEKAMLQSADEAAAWSGTKLARFTLSLCNELELKSDELRGITPFDSEKDGIHGVRDAIDDALLQLHDALSGLRHAAIDEVDAGYEDEDFSERLALETPTVSEALAKIRKEKTQ